MDLFSNLPDEVLSHIISFLSTKEAALTSVLSKRWRNLFAFVPNLDFDDSDFLHPEEGKRERDEIIQSFMDFVDRVLALQGDSPIKKLSLKCKTGVASDRVDRWICNVLQRGVSVLSLSVDFVDEYKLPPEIFVSASLKELFLHSNSCQDLLNPKSISFDTPSMVYFEYSDYVVEDYPKVNLTNLVDARLDLKLTEDHIERARAQEDDDVFLRFRNVWKLFSGIRNVQKLYLAANTLEVLSLCCESMPVFNNLKLLNIRSEEGRGWQAMPVLLKNCPHLETLVLEGLLHFVTGKCGDACDCIYHEDRGRSLASSPVKKLQIKGFRGTMKEKGMIKYFLDYLQCLKEMEIYAEENEATDLQVPKVFELLTIFDSYYTCDIQFFVRGSLYKK